MNFDLIFYQKWVKELSFVFCYAKKLFAKIRLKIVAEVARQSNC